jgi:hypothetical protein
MNRILGLVVAGGLWMGMASAAEAQFSLSIGTPYYGGYGLGLPYAGVYGGGVYAAPYAAYGLAPGATFYSSGYTGVYPAAAPIVPPVGFGVYGYRPFYGVGVLPRYGYYGGFRRFGYGGFGPRRWGYW